MGVLKNILNYFKTMMSGSDEASSKRFAALFTLLNIIIMAYWSTIHNNGITPQYIFEALCCLTAGGLGLTVAEKLMAKAATNKADADANKTPENK